METQKKRGRGRPAGSKDKQPRVYRSKTLGEPVTNDSGLLSVEEQIKRLTRPVRVSTLSAISGLSEATLRKKIEQGKLRAFKRSGMVLVEPKDFLAYWLGGKNAPTLLILRSSPAVRSTLVRSCTCTDQWWEIVGMGQSARNTNFDKMRRFRAVKTRSCGAERTGSGQAEGAETPHSIIHGHESIKTTEKSYAKWFQARQDRLDTLVIESWDK